MNSIQSFISRRRENEEGFTLIELMVVVLIIAILIAIAIPQFLGARERAQDAGAKSDLRNGLTAEKTVYVDAQAYTDVSATLLAVEPSLKWGTAPVVTVGDVGTSVDQVVCLEQDSKSGATFAIADVAVGASAGTYYNKGACSTTVATVAAWTGW